MPSVRERLDDLELLDDRPGQPCVTITGSALGCFDFT